MRDDEATITEHVNELIAVLAKAHSAWVKARRLEDVNGEEESFRRAATYISLRAMMNAFRINEVPEATAAQLDEFADSFELPMKALPNQRLAS